MGTFRSRTGGTEKESHLLCLSERTHDGQTQSWTDIQVLGFLEENERGSNGQPWKHSLPNKSRA